MASFQFSYTLTQQEVYDGLRLSGVYKQSGKRAIIESVLLGVFFLFFLVSFLLEWDAFDLGMTLVAGVVILVLNLVPRLDMKRKAKQGLRDVKLRLYAKKAYIDTKAGSQSIDLDGSAAIKAVKGKEGQMVTALLPEGGLLIIPVRAIPKEIRGQVLNLLLQSGRNDSE